MAHEEKKKEEEATKQPDPNKPLPPREVTDDELDGVVGGLASTGGGGTEPPCLT